MKSLKTADSSRTQRPLFHFALSLGFESTLVLMSAALITLGAVLAVGEEWLSVPVFVGFIATRTMLSLFRKRTLPAESAKLLRKRARAGVPLGIAEEVDPLTLSTLSEGMLLCSVLVAIFGATMQFEVDQLHGNWMIAYPIYFCSASMIMGSMAFARLSALSKYLRDGRVSFDLAWDSQVTSRATYSQELQEPYTSTMNA